ncbi:MAG: alpha/beta hydrolase [Bacteroidales bacterium]|nr:alpha/beta hydrolase [Bacteroidales bacterium]
MNKLRIILCAIIAAAVLPTAALAQDSGLQEKKVERRLYDKSVVFATVDTTVLGMDIYLPKPGKVNGRCVIYSYGGGFIENNQRATSTQDFCRRLADDGYFVAAIDYRLGLKGVKMNGVLSMVKPLMNAVQMAAEDLFRAVNCILDNAPRWGIDPESIILCGSSAGAITSLQADYELANRTPMTAGIPEDFRFAGIVSFAGAVFSTEGQCDYTVHSPSPTFFLHGTADNLVTYNKIQFFNKGFFGSNQLAARFEKFGFPYKIMRFEGEGHSVASRMNENYDDVIWFIDNMAIGKRNLRIDETFNDVNRELQKWDRISAGKLYK